jgi:hypothetical protein
MAPVKLRVVFLREDHQQIVRIAHEPCTAA